MTQPTLKYLAGVVLALGVSQAMAQAIPTPDPSAPFPASEITYPGTSATRAFVATDPYLVNIQGVMTPVNLLSKPRSYDFSGDLPFVNPSTSVSDPNVLQAWDPATKLGTNLAGGQILNKGLPERIYKVAGGGLLVRHMAGDGLLGGTGRSSLVTYAVPPRTHVRWEMTVTFGSVDGENQWVLTKYDTHPVLFWELKSPNTTTPPISAVVDTDQLNPAKLAIKLQVKGGKSPTLTSIATVRNLPIATPIPIVIEAFLDEREIADGGKGRVKCTVNGVMVGDMIGPTLSLGPNVHLTNFSAYSYKDTVTVDNTRAVLFQQARLLVLP